KEFVYMTYAIKIKEPAARWLKKYDKEIQKRFAVKIRKLKENPDLYGKPLRGVLHGFSSYFLALSIRSFTRSIIKKK
ncbi:MAG: type II toxin-antitoxin system RelE/ParE family toxin, partial [Candidatus Hydrothermarchaeales archaeon]